MRAMASGVSGTGPSGKLVLAMACVPPPNGGEFRKFCRSLCREVGARDSSCEKSGPRWLEWEAGEILAGNSWPGQQVFQGWAPPRSQQVPRLAAPGPALPDVAHRGEISARSGPPISGELAESKKFVSDFQKPVPADRCVVIGIGLHHFEGPSPRSLCRMHTVARRDLLPHSASACAVCRPVAAHVRKVENSHSRRFVSNRPGPGGCASRYRNVSTRLANMVSW